MTALRINVAFLLLLACVGACLDPFSAPRRNSNAQFLVVDGTFNPNDTTEIRLSRTVNLGATEQPPREGGALIQIENQAGQRVSLREVEFGRYILPPGQITGTRMRLLIATANGTRYESDFEDVLNTPPVESLTYQYSPLEGLDYLLTTQAESNSATFFKWQFEETWVYTAAYESVLRFVDGRIEARDEINYVCWKTERSNTILVGSTTGKTNGTIANEKMLSIRARNEKLRFKHSLRVRQQAISRAAFEYWDQLAKNSQNLGSLFDPIPSELPGNIRCVTNPDEPVLGYFSAAQMTDKRAFFDANSEPTRPPADTPFANCRLDTVRDLRVFNPKIYEIVTALPFQIGPGYTYTLDVCIDCRFRGGTTKKPPFWE